MTLTRTRRLTSTPPREWLILLAHAFVVWALCGATMAMGLAATTVQAALVLHAIGAPIFAGVASWNYGSRFGYTAALQTAVVFVSFVVVVDFFLVALIINRSLEMFASPLGTWIPFTLIFASAYLTSREVERRQRDAPQRS